MSNLVVIDYQAGNLRSVVRALEMAGAHPRITSDPEEVRQAQAVVFPGQGACDSAMRALEAEGLTGAVQEFLRSGRPFLGVCLGLQLLLDFTEEGGVPCLGIFPGRVRRLPPGLKVPHMGWNQVHFLTEHLVFQGIPQDSYLYFVHSYYADSENPGLVAATTTYGLSFCAAIAQDNLVATQFHPEKSGQVGLQVYRNFVAQLAR